MSLIFGMVDIATRFFPPLTTWKLCVIYSSACWQNFTFLMVGLMGQRLLFCVWMMQASHVIFPTHSTFLEEIRIVFEAQCAFSQWFHLNINHCRHLWGSLQYRPKFSFLGWRMVNLTPQTFICIRRSMWSCTSDRVHILHNYFCPAIESGEGQDPELLICCWHM